MENTNQNIQNLSPVLPNENTMTGEGGVSENLRHENILEAGHIVPELKKDVEIARAREDQVKIVEPLAQVIESVTTAGVLPVADPKLKTLIKILKNVQDSTASALRLLQGADERLELMLTDVGRVSTSVEKNASRNTTTTPGKIIEGVFDGEHMVGSDGTVYNVPPNYASKSKMVEGDLLKLTITGSGAFVYKQIGPTERDRLVGTLLENKETGEYAVTVNDRVFRVLKASISYFKGEEGDEVVLLVPKNAPSRFAAVENVVKKRV